MELVPPKARVLRGGLAIAVACFLVAVVATVALAESIGTSTLGSTTARSTQDVNRDATKSYNCGAGQYIVEAEPVPGYSGVYPDVKGISMYCWNAGDLNDDSRDRSVGVIRCEGSTAVTGLMVNADRFIKDWKFRCGEITDSAGTVSIKDKGYTDWVLDHVEKNDTQTTLSCGSGKVVTGLRFGYKGDENYTSVQLYCATLTSTSGGSSTSHSSSTTTYATVGTPALNAGKATSDQDANQDGTWTANCGTDQFLVELTPTGGYAGVYPAMVYNNIYCWSPIDLNDDSQDRSVGLIRCEGDTALTGLMVNADRFVKDYRFRCGELKRSSTSISITDRGYTDWVLDRVESNDTQTILYCGSGQVATGVRIGYKLTGTQKNFTSVQLYCAPLSMTGTAGTTTSTKTTTTTIHVTPTTNKPVTTTTRVTTTTPKPVTTTTTRITTTTPKPVMTTTVPKLTTTTATTTVHT